MGSTIVETGCSGNGALCSLIKGAIGSMVLQPTNAQMKERRRIRWNFIRSRR